MSLPDEIRDLVEQLTAQSETERKATGFDWDGFRRVWDELVGTWLARFSPDEQQNILAGWDEWYKRHTPHREGTE